MALTCARCGTQNPGGNQFCQACGTPLTAAAAAPAAPPAPHTGPMPGPPPGAPPPGYQSPYYSPAAGMAQPVHRTPWVLIVAAILALVVVMAGCGTVIAVLGTRTHKASTTDLSAQLPSPTPAGSPSPIQSPLPSPSAAPGTQSTAGFSLTVPSGWQVSNVDDESISLVDPSGRGSLTVAAGASGPPQTAQQNKDTLTKFFTSHYPDTKECPNSKTTTGSLNGAPGIFWELCFTVTSGGQSFQAGAPMFAGANASGNVYYAVILITSADNMATFAKEAKPVLQSIVWKLK